MPGGALRGDSREASSVYLCNLESDADEGVDFKACPKPVGFISHAWLRIYWNIYKGDLKRIQRWLDYVIGYHAQVD